MLGAPVLEMRWIEAGGSGTGWVSSGAPYDCIGGVQGENIFSSVGSKGSKPEAVLCAF